MPEKDRNNFFDELEEHSKIKLQVLKNYIKPWMRKILLSPHNNKSCLIVDTFAGVGKYDDGSLGSPLIITREAIDCIKQLEKMHHKVDNIFLVFIEQKKESYKLLKKNLEEFLNQNLKEGVFNKVNNCGALKITLINDTHETFVENLLNDVDKLVPSFFFFDPFGFSVPFELNKQLLQKYDLVELLINFMYEELTRFIELESISESIKSLYGINSLDDIKDKIKGKKGKERREIITSLYKNQLINSGAKYTLNFDIQRNTGHFKMSLMYATKNLIGFDTMKNVLNELSSTEGKKFEYWIDKDKGQLKLELYPKDEILVSELADYLFSNFKGETIKSKDIIEKAMFHPYIPSKYYCKSMRLLNKNNKIKKIFRINGKNVRKNSFPKDCYIEFHDV
ncbi:MAG: three-Cys-motif partner protein TcmP [Mollicutes bacterium]|nr:three-Cys-motif partner protein TcmP [Mollicutes bacterium]